MSALPKNASTNLPLIGRMMETVGIDPVDLAQESLGIPYGQALRRCASCDHGEACEAWLDLPHAPGTNPPAFCANRAYFAAKSG